MNPNITNVLNPKALEKQIKIYDTRLQTLMEEVDELQRMRAACSLLLGAPAEAAPESEAARNSKKAKAKSEGPATDESALPPPDSVSTEVPAEL
jgi:hypothetical protein